MVVTFYNVREDKLCEDPECKRGHDHGDIRKAVAARGKVFKNNISYHTKRNLGSGKMFRKMQMAGQRATLCCILTIRLC